MPAARQAAGQQTPDDCPHDGSSLNLNAELILNFQINSCLDRVGCVKAFYLL